MQTNKLVVTVKRFTFMDSWTFFHQIDAINPMEAIRALVAKHGKQSYNIVTITEVA